MADALSRAHRQAQVAIQAASIRAVMRLWPMLDLDRIVVTWPPLERALLALVREHGPMSASLAARYYRAHRRAANVAGAPPRAHSTPETADILAGLRVVGPVQALQQLSKGRPVAQVADVTLTKLSGAVGMYVTDYARDTLTGMVRNDRRALGWARQTSGAPCAFCAMLASRGPVYRSEDTADFQSHRACACMPVPQWAADQAWPDGAQGFAKQWDDATRGVSGADSLNAFRRSLEGR